MRGKSGTVRQQALTTADFNKAELHGKRLDKTGPARRVRDVPPLVHGSLDIVEAREKWMDGVSQQGQTKAIHMLIQWPTDLPFNKDDPEKTEKAMLAHSIRFANRYHGGDAVFAARMDRDEAGRHTVDVFLMPRYDFEYKDGRKQKRASVSKFSKENARSRFSELVEPGEDLKHPDSPIVQGRALQAAWFDYLREDCKLQWVEPPQRKKIRIKDRLEPEEIALQRSKQDAEAERLMILANAKDDAENIRGKAKRQVVLALKEIEDRTAAVAAREKEVARDAAIVAAVRSAAGKPDPQLDEMVERNRNRRRIATGRE